MVEMVFRKKSRYRSKRRTGFRRKRSFKKKNLFQTHGKTTYNNQPPRKRMGKTFARLKRQLGVIAEKKYLTTPSVAKAFTYITEAANRWTPLIGIQFPGVGTASNQRIGDHIFIRYINIYITLFQNSTNWLTGPIRMVIVKSKAALGNSNAYWNQTLGLAQSLTSPPLGGVPPLFLDKMLDPPIKFREAIPAAPKLTPNSWKITIKIMKDYNLDASGAFNHSEYYLAFLHNGPDTITGAPELQVGFKMTWTDI